jgi:hypothetical protein
MTKLNMSNLLGDFMDSQNINIINGVPHFLYNGNSYIEKLKNGLPLDLVFEMEDSSIAQECLIEECIEEKRRHPFNYEMFSEEYDCEPFPQLRKGKKIVKQPSGKNMKKNKVKQNGYYDKLYNIDVNLPSLVVYENYEGFIYENDEYYECDYTNSDDSFSFMDSYGYVPTDYSYDSYDDWNNANHTGIGWD